MKKITIILLAICLCSSVGASELTFDFDSPSFSGKGKSSHYLTIENIEKTRSDAIKAAEKRVRRAVAATKKARTHLRVVRNRFT